VGEKEVVTLTPSSRAQGDDQVLILDASALEGFSGLLKFFSDLS
jgi:hypothetical protein